VKSNSVRILSEVVAIDAWHKPIKVGKDAASVHVELTFKQGRIGGENTDFPFTFRICLKKAVLTVKVEHGLDVERASVARNIPQASVEHTKLRVARDQALTKLGAGIKLTPSRVAAEISVNGQASSEQNNEEQLKLVQSLPQTLVTYEPAGRTEYRWSLVPVFDEELNGQPWHAISEPRLSVRQEAQGSKIEPVISVELSCALEDLEITDIEPKENPKLSDKIREFVFHDTNKAAAIQHLKLVLRDADLEPGQLDNRFSHLLIASVLALEE
jgi:hypothetical protein